MTVTPAEPTVELHSRRLRPEVLAFVGAARIRVRWNRRRKVATAVRCDVCGPGWAPWCSHAKAVAAEVQRREKARST